MSAPRDEPSLADLWRCAARGATDAQLAACAAMLPATVVASVVIDVVRPQWALRWWPLTALPFLVAAFGIWGIGDREIDASAAKWRWRSVQAFAVAVAILSGAVIVLWFLLRAVGTWIS